VIDSQKPTCQLPIHVPYSPNMVVAWMLGANRGGVGKTRQRLKAGEECNTATQTQELKCFSTICRIPVSPFVVIVKAGQRAWLKTIFRRPHAASLLAIGRLTSVSS